jgi:hypothetical protein
MRAGSLRTWSLRGLSCMALGRSPVVRVNGKASGCGTGPGRGGAQSQPRPQLNSSLGHCVQGAFWGTSVRSVVNLQLPGPVGSAAAPHSNPPLTPAQLSPRPGSTWYRSAGLASSTRFSVRDEAWGAVGMGAAAQGRARITHCCFIVISLSTSPTPPPPPQLPIRDSARAASCAPLGWCVIGLAHARVRCC